MKSILSIILVFLITSFSVQENNIEGLKIRFKKVKDDYVPSSFPTIGAQVPNTVTTIPNYSTPIEANQGMKFVKLKLILTNESSKDCTFDFKDVYISTEQDSLYAFYGFDGYHGFLNTKTRIKPQTEIKRLALFEFPENAKPKELFIEDRRFKIIEN